MQLCKSSNHFLTINVKTFHHQIPSNDRNIIKPCIVIENRDNIHVNNGLSFEQLRDRVLGTFSSEHPHLKHLVASHGEFFFRYHDLSMSCYRQFSLNANSHGEYSVFQSAITANSPVKVGDITVHFTWKFPIKLLATSTGKLIPLGDIVYDSREQGSTVDTTSMAYIKNKVLHQSCLHLKLQQLVNDPQYAKNLIPSLCPSDYELYCIKEKEPFGCWSVSENIYPLKYESIVYHGCTELCVAIPPPPPQPVALPKSQVVAISYMWRDTHSLIDVPSLLQILQDESFKPEYTENQNEYYKQSENSIYGLLIEKCHTTITPYLDNLACTRLGLTVASPKAFSSTASKTPGNVVMNMRQIMNPFLTTIAHWSRFKSIDMDCMLPTGNGPVTADYLIHTMDDYPIVIVYAAPATDEACICECILDKLFHAMFHLLTTSNKEDASTPVPTKGNKRIREGSTKSTDSHSTATIDAVIGIFSYEIPGSHDPRMIYFCMQMGLRNKGAKKVETPQVTILGKNSFKVLSSSKYYDNSVTKEQAIVINLNSYKICIHYPYLIVVHFKIVNKKCK